MSYPKQDRFHRPVVLIALAIALFAGAAGAQSTVGEARDIDFEIINATTMEPGEIDRLQIEYFGARREPVVDIEPSGSSFEVEDVPLRDIAKYLITAWTDGVPYFWSFKGQQLISGPTTLHVFETTDDLADVHIPGLTVIFRKGDSLVEFEYMINIDNDNRPQRTVLGRDYTFEMILPPTAADIEATYTRGPAPLPVEVSDQGGGRYGLKVPLTTGRNQVRIAARMPWKDGLEFTVGSNLEIAAWGFMAAPENLQVLSLELEQDSQQPAPGYLRFVGPPLDAGRDFDIRVNKGIPAGEPEEVFTEDVPETEKGDAAADAGEDGDKGIPLVLQILPIVLIIILLAARRRKAKKAE